MPSRWSTSGIDWNDISNNRTEAVISELYRAIRERDYWYKILSSSRDVQVSKPTHYRSINQLRYIYEIFNRWFLPSTDYIALSGQREGFSVFVDLDGTADGTFNSSHLGKGNVDLSKLSTILGRDVTYISQGLTENRFVEYSILKDFYDILQLQFNNRNFYEEFNDFTGFVRIKVPFRFNTAEGTRQFIRELNDGGFDSDFSVAISEYNSSNNINPFAPTSRDSEASLSISRSGVLPFSVLGEVRFLDSLYLGYDGTQYTSMDFNTKSFIYVTTANQIPQTTPQLVENNEYLYEDETVISLISPPPNTNTALYKRVSAPKFNITETTEDDYNVFQRCMPFINIDKEGFLEYYTE